MNRLCHFPDVIVEEMDDNEILLYSPTTHKAIHLNATAAVIWKLCDGSRNVRDVVDCLGTQFPDAKVGMTNDIKAAIDQLLCDGVLIERPPESTG